MAEIPNGPERDRQDHGTSFTCTKRDVLASSEIEISRVQAIGLITLYSQPPPLPSTTKTKDPTMRRAQSVRHYARPSLALASDDLGMLREGAESDEDVLRKQLIEKDRECDRVRHTITLSDTNAI